MKNIRILLVMLIIAATNSSYSQGIFNLKPSDVGNNAMTEKINKATQKAIADNPSLISERNEIHKEFSRLKALGKNVDPGDLKDLYERQLAYEKKWKAALYKADPEVESYLTQLEAKRKARAILDKKAKN